MLWNRLRELRPIEAGRSLFAVLQKPEDTEQVFRLVDAMTGGTRASFRARFERSRAGARLLADQPDILAILGDPARLEALPAGSLGRAYLQFVRRDGLTPDGLVAASQAGGRVRDGVDGYIQRRMRDTHDLWHTVLGYGPDLIGEGAVLAFTYAQTRNPGVGLLVAAGLLRADDPDARALIVDALARGLRAAWLPAQRWEELLSQPLDDVRARLRVGPAPQYEPFYARDLPPGGLMARVGRSFDLPTGPSS
jgi:ubiquinone biosynthesis protein COQ4